MKIPGQLSAEINSIPILVGGDTAVEPAETFLLTITTPGLNTVTSTGTISNDDAAAGPVAILFEDSTVARWGSAPPITVYQTGTGDYPIYTHSYDPYSFLPTTPDATFYLDDRVTTGGTGTSVSPFRDHNEAFLQAVCQDPTKTVLIYNLNPNRSVLRNQRAWVNNTTNKPKCRVFSMNKPSAGAALNGRKFCASTASSTALTWQAATGATTVGYRAVTAITKANSPQVVDCHASIEVFVKDPETNADITDAPKQPGLYLHAATVGEYEATPGSLWHDGTYLFCNPLAGRPALTTVAWDGNESILLPLPTSTGLSSFDQTTTTNDSIFFIEGYDYTGGTLPIKALFNEQVGAIRPKLVLHNTHAWGGTAADGVSVEGPIDVYVSRTMACKSWRDTFGTHTYNSVQGAAGTERTPSISPRLIMTDGWLIGGGSTGYVDSNGDNGFAPHEDAVSILVNVVMGGNTGKTNGPNLNCHTVIFGGKNTGSIRDSTSGYPKASNTSGNYPNALLLLYGVRQVKRAANPYFLASGQGQIKLANMGDIPLVNSADGGSGDAAITRFVPRI